MLTNEKENQPGGFCDEERMVYVEEKEKLEKKDVNAEEIIVTLQMHTIDVESAMNEAPSILTTPKSMVVETGTLAVFDETVVDKLNAAAEGNRKEVGLSYQKEESLATCLECKTEVLAGREEQEQVVECEWTAFVEDDANSFETYLEVLLAVVDRYSPKFNDTAVGSREEDESYENKEPLAERLECEKEGLTGNGKEERNKGKREQIMLDNERRGLEDATRKGQTLLDVLRQ
jgi:hypothetical protein